MFERRDYWWLAFIAVAATAIGCGNRSEQDLEVASESVIAALASWKQGDSPKSLMSGSLRIEFHDDDWQSGARLVDYRLRKTYRGTDGRPRCAATLTVEHAGDAKTLEVTYEVNTTPRIVVARDPYS